MTAIVPGPPGWDLFEYSNDRYPITTPVSEIMGLALAGGWGGGVVAAGAPGGIAYVTAGNSARNARAVASPTAIVNTVSGNVTNAYRPLIAGISKNRLAFKSVWEGVGRSFCVTDTVMGNGRVFANRVVLPMDAVGPRGSELAVVTGERGPKPVRVKLEGADVDWNTARSTVWPVGGHRLRTGGPPRPCILIVC